MKKTVIVVIGFFCIYAFSGVHLAMATDLADLDENELSSLGADASSPDQSVAAPAILIEMKERKPIQARLNEETMFDANGDGALSHDEITNYLNYIENEIKNTGSYPVHSDILYHFDQNKDEKLDASELQSLRNYGGY